jgi:hypothetical protein
VEDNDDVLKSDRVRRKFWTFTNLVESNADGRVHRRIELDIFLAPIFDYSNCKSMSEENQDSWGKVVRVSD